MDVRTAFLQGDLTDEIYMKQPRSKENPDHVCKLKKSLYGLKHSARCWNSTLDSFLKSSGYKQVGADSCLYMKSVKLQNGKINFVILSIHVDDILWFSNDVIMLEEEKVAIGTKFKVENLGEVSHILGMLIKRDRYSRTLTIIQVLGRSSTEAEYMALSLATQEAIWLRRLLENIGVKQKESTVMCEDNQAAIQLSRNPKFHNRTKNISM
ncbi:Hypothetical predicted protein [Paramuricea clavata]|uniref:Uncharacterized protein n=1 Tax=Paramuricea clavata TaxID=317549 RepID=A0A7D9MA27_PARCT|nr:Hypothetical predicted protein [Paramuricea clavata]